jgi:uncharacterized protein YbaP (TraB family)
MIMKRFISFFAVLVVMAGTFSCTSAPPRQQTGSSVWRVSKGGNTLFLGGSVHILRERDFPLPAEFDRAFSQSAVLVLEADTGQMGNPEIATYLMSRMTLPDNKTLRSVLDAETYQLLAAACTEYGLPISTVARLKPSMVVSVLTVLQIQKFGFVEKGVDDHYLEKARTENKPVLFLETVEFQIDAIVSMGDGYENDYVRYSLQDMDDTEESITGLVAEWKKGVITKTEESLTEMREDWPAIYQTLVTERNNAWIPQIVEFMDSGKVHFVVVGLAHMPGPDGLLRLLENLGYTVEQYK